MRNKDCQCVGCVDPQTKQKRKKPVRSSSWFTDHAIIWIEANKQREVILNPGKEVSWFKKKYPMTGELNLTRMSYLKELPPRVTGKIVAVSAIEGTTGKLRPKPLGTFYELFEGSGFRIWTNPSEYESTSKKKQWKKRPQR